MPEIVEIKTNGDFPDVKKTKAIILFHMNGCGHCTIFKPEFKKAAKAMSAYRFYTAESRDVPKLMREHGITAFPTIHYWYNGKRHEFPKDMYPPDFEKLKKWVRSVEENSTVQQQQPPSKRGEVNMPDTMGVVKSDTDLEKIKSGKKPQLVLFYSDNCVHCKDFKPEFYQMAREDRGVTCNMLNGPQLRKLVDQEEVKHYPTLHLYINGKKYVFPTEQYPPTAQKIRIWVKSPVTKKLLNF
jgi:thiol-disulfide isomerase/thioredoxin